MASAAPPYSAPIIAHPQSQAQLDFAQSLEISETNSLGEIHVNHGIVAYSAYMTSKIIYKRPVLLAPNHFASGGKFALQSKVGGGMFGTAFKACYWDAQGHHKFDLVAKILVVKQATDLVNNIPRRIVQEFFIQKKHRNVVGVVHAHYAAELECNAAPGSLFWVQLQLFGGRLNAFEPVHGDRIFMFCMPAYDYDLATCLEYESYFLHYGRMPINAPRNARAPPSNKEDYLWLTLRRFYRLYDAVGEMHKEKDGHFDIRSLNILVRHSQDQHAVDLCDFGLASSWEEESKNSVKWNPITAIHEDHRRLKWDNAATCFAPESVKAAVGETYGVPYPRYLFDQKQNKCEEEYLAFDYWGLGYTLFEMLQSGYLEPNRHLHWEFWAQSGGLAWLRDCIRLIGTLPTSFVVKNFAMAFLQQEPASRLAAVQKVMTEFPTEIALWRQHQTETLAMAQNIHGGGQPHAGHLYAGHPTAAAASSAHTQPRP